MLNRWPRSIASGILLAGAAAAGPGHAADRFDTAHGPTIGIDFGAAYVSLPRLNSLGFAVDAGNYDFIRQYGGSHDPSGVGPAVSVHLGFPEFGGRGWFGDARMNVDIEAFWIVESIRAGTTLEPGEFLDLLPIDGGPNFGGLYYEVPFGFDHADIRSRGDARFSAVDVAWTVERDVNGNGLSVLAGPRVAYQSQSIDATTTSSAAFYEFLLEEDVSTWFVGPDVGLRKTGDLGGGASFEVIARAAALYFDSRFKGSQEVLVDGDPVFRLATRDSRDGFSGRIELGSGVTIPFPNSRALLSLNGSVAWWSAVPQIVNPKSGPGINAATEDFRSARLGTDDMWTAKATAKVTIPLN